MKRFSDILASIDSIANDIDNSEIDSIDVPVNVPVDVPVETTEESNIVQKLKNALKEELNAWYGYTIVREYLAGAFRPDVVKLYDELAEDELKDHGYWLMKRINELSGVIDDITTSPASWLQATHTYRSPQWNEDGSLIPVISSIETNIKNEQDAIETYKELIQLTESVDWSTNAKCKSILADEEEHLQMLQDILNDIQES